MAAFGAHSAEYVRRAVMAAEQTTAWIGIQSTEGRAPKDGSEGDDIPTLAEVAASHEYGGKNGRPPMRSYLRSTADAEGRAWLSGLRAAIRAYASGDEAGYTQRVRTMGVLATGQIRGTIRRRIAPPLAASTIAARRKGPARNVDGSIPDDVPLIDTGQLIGSIRAQAATVAGRIVTG